MPEIVTADKIPEVLGADTSTLGTFSIQGKKISGNAKKVNFPSWGVGGKACYALPIAIPAKSREGTKVWKLPSETEKQAFTFESDDDYLVLNLGEESINVTGIVVKPKQGDEVTYTLEITPSDE